VMGLGGNVFEGDVVCSRTHPISRSLEPGARSQEPGARSQELERAFWGLGFYCNGSNELGRMRIRSTRSF
jgi:hypothetical protein